MSIPFIGMNPRLESPDLWTEVHHRLISAIAIHLGPTLRPKYRVAIEKRVYFSDSEPILDLQALLNEIYDQAGFDLTTEQ